MTAVYVLNYGLHPQILRLQDTLYITETMFTALQMREVITAVRILLEHMEIEMFSRLTVHARHIRITYQWSFI